VNTHSTAALAIAVSGFLAVLLWRVRPRWPWRSGRRELASALHDARARIAAASDEPSRAVSLCDAADIVARSATTARGWARVAALLRRALRSDPGSLAIVTRSIAALAHRPRELESALWSHLAQVPWHEAPEAIGASLRALRSVYEGPIRRSTRAKALKRAEESLASSLKRDP